jgi:cyclopropane-fatty-acyl-phospholipid synthase
VSHVLRVMAEQGLEGLDTENLRPHYARTLWAWSDALEAQLDDAARSPATRWCAPTGCTWRAAR